MPLVASRVQDFDDDDAENLRLEVYGMYMQYSIKLFWLDIIRTIRDPEKPHTLEELDVINEDSVEVTCKTILYKGENILRLDVINIRGQRNKDAGNMRNLVPHDTWLLTSHEHWALH